MEQLNSLASAGQRVVPASGGASARQASLRQSNLRLLTALVYACAEPVSRAGLAAVSGLTRSTTSRLVDELVEGGLVDELAPLTPVGPGRPAVPLVPAGGTWAALGMEVNTGGLTLRVIDLSGRVLTERGVDGDLAGSEPAPVLGRLGELATDVLDRLPDQVRRLGWALALPGLVDPGTGRLLQAPNLGWREVDAAGLIGARSGWGTELSVGNEAELAALSLAQTRPGRPGRYSDFVFVSAEVGIGGAIVVGGQVLRGSNGWAGEIGHLNVEQDGRPCRCGSHGCLEQYAGRAAILRAARLPPSTRPAALAALAGAGHSGVRTALAEAGRTLGVALSAVVNLLDIPTLLIGGDLAALAEHVRPAAERELARRVLSADWVAPQVIAVTADAATGAAYRVLDAVLADPAGRL